MAESWRAELVDTTARPADTQRWYGFSVFLPSAVWQQPDAVGAVIKTAGVPEEVWHFEGPHGWWRARSRPSR